VAPSSRGNSELRTTLSVTRAEERASSGHGGDLPTVSTPPRVGHGPRQNCLFDSRAFILPAPARVRGTPLLLAGKAESVPPAA
jgi:hypothetical protein